MKQEGALLVLIAGLSAVGIADTGLAQTTELEKQRPSVSRYLVG